MSPQTPGMASTPGTWSDRRPPQRPPGSSRLSRRLSGALLSLAALALSCELRPTATAALPDVSAPPPTAAAAPTPKIDAGGEAEIAEIAARIARHRTGLTRFEVDALARTIWIEGRRHELRPSLVLAVMHVESRFHNFAVSQVGALGLMQILPSTGAEVARAIGVDWRGPQSLFEPETNVKIGVAYLRWLLDRYRGDLRTALAAYNWGPGHITRRMQRGDPMPTAYSSAVLAADGARARERRS